MKYFILLKDDTLDDLQYSSNILGDESFGTFYTEQGFGILVNLVTERPEHLEETVILDEKKQKYTVGEFLNKLDKLKVLIN